jgi:hypothetical protein
MPPTDHTLPSLDLHLWDHTSTPLRPSKGELARLGVQAGRYLALHTLRPTPAPQPPRSPRPGEIASPDGWVQLRGWQKILPHPDDHPAPGAFPPEAIGRRLSPPLPAEIRRLLRKTARDLHTQPWDTLPDGVALALDDGRPLPDSYWAYLGQGWAQSITGAPASALRLPPLHDSITAAYRDARTWLHREITDTSKLAPVAEALTTPTPGSLPDLVEARALLEYDRPGPVGPSARPHRIMLARLVSLYWTALETGDTPIIDLATGSPGH